MIDAKEIFVQQLRIGFIGAGGIAGVHIVGWQELGAQVSVYSRSGAAALVQQYGVTEVDSLDALLVASDMVSILTPTTSHHHYAMAAIAAGKDVICEKPLAESSGLAAKIANAAAAAGVRLFPAHVVRFFPDYVAAKDALGSGRIGTPSVLWLSRASAAPAPGSWFFNESLGGGIMRDQMIHDLDQARWLAGEVTEVHAVQDPPSVDGIVPRPVSARIVLTHENGAVSHLRGLWGPDSLPFSTSLSVEGAHGTISYASPHESVGQPHGESPGSGPASAGAEHADADYAGAEQGSYLPELTPAESPYTLQNAEFAAARASGEPSRVSPYDGVMAVALAEAAAESIKCGRAVEFSAPTVLALLDRAPAA